MERFRCIDATSHTSQYTQTHIIDSLIEQGLTSHSTQFRPFQRRSDLQVWWPNQQCQSTEGGWL